jgi:hypothetical protein
LIKYLQRQKYLHPDHSGQKQRITPLDMLKKSGYAPLPKVHKRFKRNLAVVYKLLLIRLAAGRSAKKNPACESSQAGFNLEFTFYVF